MNIFNASVYSRMRITSKTVYNIMDNNCAVRFVPKFPNVNNREDLLSLTRAYVRNGASRRLLGDYFIIPKDKLRTVMIIIKTLAI